MREDFIEQLERMFPKGYVMIYTNPDGSMRVSMLNPNLETVIFNQYKDIQERWGIDEPKGG